MPHIRPDKVARLLALGLSASLAAGCATTAPPYVGQGPHPQISRGHPLPPIDFLGNVFALPTKLILCNWKVDNHAVSADTERYLVKYVDLPESVTDGTHYSLNEYNPGLALGRLIHNRKVAWPYRLLLGLPVTLIADVLLPGRLFAGLLTGDSYNPYTDIVSIYSDLPSVALHEAGHSHDFNKRRHKGTYAAMRLIPFVDLYQEHQASDAAFHYLIETEDHPQELAAYKVLYPAYGTYVGGYFLIPGGGLIGALLGHAFGHSKAQERAGYYARQDAAMISAATATSARPSDTAPSAQPTPSAAPADPSSLSSHSQEPSASPQQ